LGFLVPVFIPVFLLELVTPAGRVSLLAALQ